MHAMVDFSALAEYVADVFFEHGQNLVYLELALLALEHHADSWVEHRLSFTIGNIEITVAEVGGNVVSLHPARDGPRTHLEAVGDFRLGEIPLPVEMPQERSGLVGLDIGVGVEVDVATTAATALVGLLGRVGRLHGRTRRSPRRPAPQHTNALAPYFRTGSDVGTVARADLISSHNSLPR